MHICPVAVLYSTVYVYDIYDMISACIRISFRGYLPKEIKADHLKKLGRNIGEK